MSFKISDFKDAFSGGIARPNLWKATLTFASNMVVVFKTIPPKFSFRCEKAEIPGRSLATLDDTGSGPTLKLPYEVTYNDIEITIICANDMTERKYFEGWINYVVRPTEENYPGTIGYHDDYARGNKLELSQLDEAGSAKITYSLHDVYPINISPMNLSWEEINTYQRFSVTLNYRYYTFSPTY